MASFVKLVVLRAKEMADFTTFRVLDRDLTPKAIEREAFRVLVAHTDVWGGGAVTCPEWVTVHVDADVYDARQALFDSRQTEQVVAKKLVALFCRSFRPKHPPHIQVQFVPDDSLTKGRFTVAVSWKRPMPTPLHPISGADGAMPDVRIGLPADDPAGTTADDGSTRFLGTTRSFTAEPEEPVGSIPEFVLVSKTGTVNIPVTSAPLLIGSGAEVTAPGRIEDDTVSRRHLLVWAETNKVCLHDLGSTNGTRVNGTPTTAGAAKTGDFLRIGGAVFQVTEPHRVPVEVPHPDDEHLPGLHAPRIHGIR